MAHIPLNRGIPLWKSELMLGENEMLVFTVDE